MAATLLLAAAALQFATKGLFASGHKQCRIKIFSRHGGKSFSSMRRFFRALDSSINRILPESKTAPTIVYELVMLEPGDLCGPMLGARNKYTLRIGLPQDIDPANDGDDRLLPAIGAALLLKSGIPLTKQKGISAPKWIELAVLRKTRRKAATDRILGMVSFPGVHALLTLPHPPSLLKSLDSRLREEDGAAYEILKETCEIILDRTLMLPEGKKAVKELLDLSQEKVADTGAFKRVIGAKMRLHGGYKEKSVEQWVMNGAASSSLNLLHPGTASFGLRELKKTMLVEYRPKGATQDDEPRYCSIENLPNILDKIESPEILIKKKQRDLDRLAFSLPAPMQEAVSGIAMSLEVLGKGEKENFVKSVRAAMSNFNAALDRCCAIESMLHQTERKLLPPLWRYGAALKETSRLNRRRRERWPEITTFLDGIEHDMASQ